MEDNHLSEEDLKLFENHIAKAKEELKPVVIEEKQLPKNEGETVLLSTTETETFIELLKVLKNVHPEVKINVKENILNMAALSLDNNYFINIDMVSLMFTEINKAPFDVIVNVDDIIKLCRGKAKKLSLVIDKDNRLICNVVGNSTKRSSIPMYNDVRTIPDVTRIKAPIHLMLASAKFKDIVEDIEAVIPEKEVGTITIQNMQDGKVICAYREANRWTEVDTDIVIKEVQIKGKYSLSYISPFIGLSKVCANLDIGIGVDVPIILDYTTKNKFQTKIIVAPLVDNEE